MSHSLSLADQAGGTGGRVDSAPRSGAKVYGAESVRGSAAALARGRPGMFCIFVFGGVGGVPPPKKIA